MAYLALYRRFRPQKFSELIGQETVVRALVNQIKTDRIGHAYLFCGARGTGKTTAAKIFARAINCLEKDGEPCGKCEVCSKLADSSNLDIVEMDAASNNKVENVREIREKVQYPPVSGRFKVYIIDEVHMLTTEAFNALLKTLEEPPKHAVFILATTEPHKLPATILSRCMRFDFKLIPTAKIADHIAKIFDEVGKKYDRDAIMEIARAGEGSVRDALSVADICVSYNNEKLTYNDVIDVLGASDRGKTAELVKAIFSSNTGDALAVVDELSGLGKGAGMMTKDVLSFLRDVMVVKTCNNCEAILALPKDKIDELKQISQMIDNNGLLRIVEIFSMIENDLKYSTHPRIVFETAVLKATMPQNDLNIDALMSRIARLEKALADGNFVQKVNAGESIKTNQNSVNQAQQTINNAKISVQEINREKVVENTEKPQKSTYSAINEKTETVKPLETRVEKPIEKVVEVVEKPIAKKVEKQTAVNDFDEQFGNYDAPPADLFADVDSKPVISEVKPVEAVKIEKIEEKIEQPKAQPISQNSIASEPSVALPDRRIWPTIVRKLRTNHNPILWAVCQELDAKIENGQLIIFANKENEYKAITKPDNLKMLEDLLKEVSSYSVAVKMAGEKVDTFNEDVEKIKRDFGVEVKD